MKMFALWGRRGAIGIVAISVVAVLLPGPAWAKEPIKWYGIGGEVTDPKRWLGRIGLSEYLGVEAIFAMEHLSQDCGQGHDCDITRLDVGAGAIYDVVPGADISPYLAGRFILTMEGDGESETSGTIETAMGAEYVLRERFGLSAELNFSFRTEPSHVLTSTRVRFFFYF